MDDVHVQEEISYIVMESGSWCGHGAAMRLSEARACPACYSESLVTKSGVRARDVGTCG